MSDKDSVLGRLLGNAEKLTAKQAGEALELLVQEAVKVSASDVHIEPHESKVIIRYRVDGGLRAAHELPLAALNNLMAEVKKQAELDSKETTTPQEGDYGLKVDGDEVEVRVATMPVYGGEKAVLHLSLQPGKPKSLEDLGLWGERLATVKSLLANPHGLVVVAGPRHSGLSTSLFSLIGQLNSPTQSVAAVETRPTYRLPGVSHTYIGKSGLSTLEGLQAALKQDPNVLLVDDVPDGPTAKEVVKAASGGHLVLVGLRADSSLAAALRLRGAGVEAFALAHVWRLGLGQRLVPQLCPDCKERYDLDSQEQGEIEAHFGLDASSRRRQLHELEQSAARAGLGAGQELNTSPSHITHLYRAHAEGCASCDHTGYQGRLAITEVLTSSDGLHKGLMSHEVFSASALQALLVKEGFVPLALDGLIKALRGYTTVADVLQAVS